MRRRHFLQRSLATAALGWPLLSCGPAPRRTAYRDGEANFPARVAALHATWVEGLLARQIDAPADAARHGALACAACAGLIHGRCLDAVYPFLRHARDTGDERFLRGATELMDWAERNVSQEDGSWTVVPNPRTWRGITVFGAIALAEALHYHGDLLPPATATAWTERLGRAGEYVYRNFDLTFTNINYGYTALYALSLLGEVLDRPHYRSRARELARGATAFLTEPHALLFGETKPVSTRRSAKGLAGVDLGYNVEESLNGAVLYALREGDTQLLTALTESLGGHLEFMLPDGGWDNGWGTRAFKWSYWGSRTTDGCQPAYALLAPQRPEFGTAVIRNTDLLARCTADIGLLYGGIHYAQHGLRPCIHHTFAHAKPLAYLLDHPAELARLTDSTPLPRTRADGTSHFPEVAVRLLARGPWRATVSTYDHLYKPGVVQGMGGALTMLYHQRLGPLFAASLADYTEVEVFNQQPDPDGEDYALTPRLEAYRDGTTFTNLYDLTARVSHSEDDGSSLTVRTTVTLKDAAHAPPPGRAGAAVLTYRLTERECIITARYPRANRLERPALLLPVISPATEAVTRRSARCLEIRKPAGTLRLAATAPLEIVATRRKRVFNMVPGAQALPLRIPFPTAVDQVTCILSLT